MILTKDQLGGFYIGVVERYRLSSGNQIPCDGTHGSGIAGNSFCYYEHFYSRGAF